MQAFAALFAGDYVNHQVSAAAPTPAGVAAKQATVAFFTHRVEALAGLKIGIEASLAQGDLCAASFVYEDVHHAVYYGVAPTGRKLRFTSCDIFKVVDGKIVEHWGMGDIAGVLAKLKG
jgi:predicted ester cyclase